MTFDEAIATQPDWVQKWVLFMGMVIAASVIALLISRETRRDSLLILVVMALTFGVMQWLYGTVGYVRLLGIVHVVLWTPLMIYLWRRLKDPAIGVPYRQIMLLLFVMMIVSLAFDYVDVVRYLFGETESMIPPI